MIILSKFVLLLLVALLTWLAKSKPDTAPGRLARKLFVVRSPKPNPKETEHDFFMRYSLWALKWFLQILIVWLAGAYILAEYQDQSSLLQAIFMFMLPMLGMMALFGSALLYLKALVCTMRKTKRVFREPEHDFVVDGQKPPI